MKADPVPVWLTKDYFHFTSSFPPSGKNQHQIAVNFESDMFIPTGGKQYILTKDVALLKAKNNFLTKNLAPLTTKNIF